MIVCRSCHYVKAKILREIYILQGDGGRVQGSANPRAPGLVKFVTAVAYHFCLNLPRAFSQPGVRGLADPCIAGRHSTGLNKLSKSFEVREKGEICLSPSEPNPQKLPRLCSEHEWIFPPRHRANLCFCFSYFSYAPEAKEDKVR